MPAILIPVLAISLSIGGPVAVAIVVLVQRHRQRQKRYDLILRATEAGRSPEEIEELMETMDLRGSGNGLLKAGCIVGGIGLGVLLIGLLNDVARESLGGGAFVFMLGVGMVAAWYFADRKAGRDAS